MKRVIAITAVFAVACSIVAAAQSSSQPQTLGAVAKAEEARRKNLKKPAKVYTNDNLKPDISVPVPPPAPATSTTAANATPGNTTPTTPGGQAPPADAKDQAYWSGRMSKARTDLTRSQMFADSLQVKINSLKTDFVNRDNRVEREKIEADLNSALAELERLKKENAALQKAISDIEEEARRAGVPAGWLRPPS